MEAGVHPALTQDADATAADGLPADFDNAGAVPRNRARRRAALHIPGAVVPAASSAFRQPVRLSTTAAIVHLIDSVINLLVTEPYVIVISLDFSKAFDTVRHSTLLYKLVQLHIPDQIYNWLVDFFDNHSHRTVFRDECHRCLASPPVSSRGQPLDQPPMSSTPETSSPLCREIRPANSLMTRHHPASNEATRHMELANVQKWPSETT